MLGKTLRMNLDAFVNAITGLGSLSRDKLMAASYQAPTEFTSVDLDNLYRGSWLVARACDRPSAEMVRKWVEIKTESDSGLGKDALRVVNKLGAKAAFQEANTWAYLYGGGLILMGIDDGQSMDMPVRREAIRKIDYLRVLDRYDVSVNSRYTSEEKPGSAGWPSSYRLNTVVDVLGASIEPIHESRFLRFDGVVTPLRRRIAMEMWCDGIVTRLFERLRGHDTAWGGIEHLLTDFAQAVLKIKDLDALLKEDASNDLMQRLMLLDMARSVTRILPLDAEMEDFERKPTPINGLGPVMQIMMEHLAGILEMPVAVLFGKATPGIGDTGNSQLKQWYDRIALGQETRIVPQAEILCGYQLAAMGHHVDDWSVDPLPLEEMSEKEQADLHKTQAEADTLMITNGVVSEIEVRRSRYGGDGYSLNTMLDEGTEEMLEQEQLGILDEPEPAPDQSQLEGAEPQKTAMNGAQIKALSDVLVAYNGKDLTKEQAAGIIEVGFLIGSQEAMRLVGEREEKPEPPAQLQPFAQPGRQEPESSEPEPEPELEPEPEPDETEDSEFKEDYIKQIGSKWVVFSESGKRLGSHDTRKEAVKQLQAIEAAKSRR